MGLRRYFLCLCAALACGGDDSAASATDDPTSDTSGTATLTTTSPTTTSDSDTSTSADTSTTTSSSSDPDSSTSSDSSSSKGSSSESSSTGTPSVCGDGVPESDEECDDGDLEDDDGCDADCVLSSVVQIAGDFSDHTCVRTRSGAVRCWGRGAFGRLGYGATTNVGDDEVPATLGNVDIGGIAIDLAAGYEHTCAVLDGGAVRCWGRGVSGRLGYAATANIGDDETPSTAGDVDVGGVAIQVVTGSQHTCALLEAGTVRCWGRGVEGQLGYGAVASIGDDETPATAGDIDLGEGAVVMQIAAGAFHTCALLESGAVRCWGDNSVGQLGIESMDVIGDDEVPSVAPEVLVVGEQEDDAVVAIAAAYGNTCALLQSGTARCWGNAANGECGYGSTENIGDEPGETPAAAGNIALDGTVVEINAGPCARLDDGAVRCWGLGITGALGLGSTASIGDDELPNTVDPIALGGVAVHQHSDGLRACAVLDDSTLRCWGANQYGQLGLGTTDAVGDDPGETPDTVAVVQVF